MNFPLRFVAEYTNSKPSEAQRGFEEFWGKDFVPDKNDTELWQYYTEWMIFDFVQKSGRSFLIEYILLNPDNLESKVINQFKQIAETYNYSNYQILSIKRGGWIKLENIFTGEIYKVYDKLGSENIPDEGTMFARVARVDGKWYLVGANSPICPITYTERMKRCLREDSLEKKVKLTPKDLCKLILEQRKNPPKISKLLTKSEIKEKRKELESKFIRKARKYGANMTFNKLLQIIHEENCTNVLDLWLSLGKKGLTEKFVVEEVQLLSDIWNHFPHRCLGGKAPILVVNCKLTFEMTPFCNI